MKLDADDCKNILNSLQCYLESCNAPQTAQATIDKVEAILKTNNAVINENWGAIGGRVKSKRKAETSKSNGKKGGRKRLDQ